MPFSVIPPISTALPPPDSYRDALGSTPRTEVPGQAAPRGLRSGLLEVGLFLADILLWLALFGACFETLALVAYASHLPKPIAILIPLAVSLFASWLVGSYDRDTDFRSLRFTSEFVLAGLIASIFGAALSSFFGSYGATKMVSRLLLLGTPVCFTFASLLMRRHLAGRRVWDHHGVRRLLLLGQTSEADTLQRALELAGRPTVVERIDPVTATRESITDCLGSREIKSTPPHITAKGSVPLDSIVIAPSAEPLIAAITPFLVSLHTRQLPVYAWGAFWRQRVRMHDVHDSSTAWLFERDFRLHRTSIHWHLKRLFDIVLAAFALLLASPLLLVAAVLIRLDSPGPALFRQPRVGFLGESFTIYKLRTMRLNAEHDGLLTAQKDPRITRLGQYLRRSRIDEIPQLINVLKGDMSFVGPRPEWTVCVKDYEDQLAYYHLRHLVKPGITGWAQVNYPYGQGVDDARNKLSFDLHYVTHASIFLDCTILLKTCYVVIGRIGGR